MECTNLFIHEVCDFMSFICQTPVLGTHIINMFICRFLLVYNLGQQALDVGFFFSQGLWYSLVVISRSKVSVDFVYMPSNLFYVLYASLQCFRF